MAHARQRSPRRFHDNAPAHAVNMIPFHIYNAIPFRNAPSDAAAERALVGPHAWSCAWVDRFAPRKEPKPSGEGSPLPHTCTARRRRPFSSPKVGMLGSGGCSGRTPIFAHITFQGAANERPQFTPLPRTTSPLALYQNKTNLSTITY